MSSANLSVLNLGLFPLRFVPLSARFSFDNVNLCLLQNLRPSSLITVLVGPSPTCYRCQHIVVPKYWIHFTFHNALEKIQIQHQKRHGLIWSSSSSLHYWFNIYTLTKLFSFSSPSEKLKPIVLPFITCLVEGCRKAGGQNGIGPSDLVFHCHYGQVVSGFVAYVFGVDCDQVDRDLECRTGSLSEVMLTQGDFYAGGLQEIWSDATGESEKD